MEKLVALTIVPVIVASAAVYAIAALKGSSEGKLKWTPELGPGIGEVKV